MVQVYRILTLVDARISHFLTQGIIFTFFFQGNWIPFLFISRSSSFPVIQVIVDIKIWWKNRFFIFFFSLLKSGRPCD